MVVAANAKPHVNLLAKHLVALQINSAKTQKQANNSAIYAKAKGLIVTNTQAFFQ